VDQILAHRLAADVAAADDDGVAVAVGVGGCADAAAVPLLVPAGSLLLGRAEVAAANEIAAGHSRTEWAAGSPWAHSTAAARTVAAAAATAAGGDPCSSGRHRRWVHTARAPEWVPVGGHMSLPGGTWLVLEVHIVAEDPHVAAGAAAAVAGAALPPGAN